jgi:hypothetical protein
MPPAKRATGSGAGGKDIGEVPTERTDYPEKSNGKFSDQKLSV